MTAVARPAARLAESKLVEIADRDDGVAPDEIGLSFADDDDVAVVVAVVTILARPRKSLLRS